MSDIDEAKAYMTSHSQEIFTQQHELIIHQPKE